MGDPAVAEPPGAGAQRSGDSTLHLIARATNVWQLDGSVLIGHCQSTRIARASAGELRFEPGLGQALAALAVNGQAPCIESMAGRWPSPLWLTTRGVADRPRLYRFRAGALERIRDGAHVLSPWREGWLALEHVAPDDYRLDPLGTRGAPRLMRNDVMEKGLPIHRLHMTRAFTSASSGEVFVFGRDRKDGGWAVERWGPSGGRSVVEPLPGIGQDAANWDPNRRGPWGTAHAIAGNDVYAAPVPELLAGDQATLLHFDGTHWSQADTSGVPGPISGIAGVSGGPLWLVAKRELWRRDAGKPWRKVQPPAGSVLHVHASDQGEIYVVTDVGIYRSRPADAVVNAYPAVDLPVASEDCAHPLVDMSTAPEGAPPSYDYSAALAKLAGATHLQGLELVDYIDPVGRRRLAAVVATMAMAQELLAVLGQSEDVLRCGRPEPLRILHVDLKTGRPR